MTRIVYMALLGSTALISVASAQPANQTQPSAAASIADCDQLIVTLEQRKLPNAPITVEQARVYKRDANVQACRDALQRVNQAQNAPGQPNEPQQAQGQDANRIVVQQPAPTVRVDQAAPQVTVQQPQPQVTVRQPQPEIVVRMPPPTISVQQPQPEVIVCMPQPDVNVAMPQPQVAVNQPQPQVQVVQPEQPKVQVEREQPQVVVQQQPGQQANVQVQQAQQQPQVRFERTGEPNIQYNMTGEPRVTYERAGQQGADQRNQQAAAPAQNQQTAATRNAETTGTVARDTATSQGVTRPMPVSRLKDMDVVNARGEQLGDVERVIVSNADNKTYVIIGHGGFLGLGEKQVALPLEQLTLRGDKLVIRGLTDDRIKAMPAWDRNNRSYRELDGNQMAQISNAE